MLTSQCKGPAPCPLLPRAALVLASAALVLASADLVLASADLVLPSADLVLPSADLVLVRCTKGTVLPAQRLTWHVQCRQARPPPGIDEPL